MKNRTFVFKDGDFKVQFVYNDDKSVNVDETMANFEAMRSSVLFEVEKYAKEVSLKNKVIISEVISEEVINGIFAVFDEYKGAAISPDEILIYGHKHFKISPDSFTDIKKQIVTYLRFNSGSKESGAIFGPEDIGKVGKLPKIFRWDDKK